MSPLDGRNFAAYTEFLEFSAMLAAKDKRIEELESIAINLPEFQKEAVERLLLALKEISDLSHSVGSYLDLEKDIQRKKNIAQRALDEYFTPTSAPKESK